MLSQNYYAMDELLACLPKAVAKKDVNIAVFVVGELAKTMEEKKLRKTLKPLGSGKTSEPYQFICSILGIEESRALKAYYNHGSKKMESRRKITIPMYALDDTTERGKGIDTTPHLFEGLPLAKEWSSEEIAKSHGVIQQNPTMDDVLEDIIGDGIDEISEEVVPDKVKPSKTQVKPIDTPKDITRIIIRKKPKQLPEAEFMPETMFSDKAPHMLAIPQPVPTMYQDGKFIKSITKYRWNDDVQQYTYDVQEIKKILGFKPLEIEHGTSFIKGVVYYCFATPNQGGECVTNGIYIDRSKHNLCDLNAVTLTRENFKPMVQLLLFRKMIGSSARTSSILQNPETGEWVFTIEVLRQLNNNNRLIVDKYHQSVELRQHMKRYSQRYVDLLSQWRDLLKDNTLLERYGINFNKKIANMIGQLHRNVLH